MRGRIKTVDRLKAQMIEMGNELQRVKAENIALRLQLEKAKGQLK